MERCSYESPGAVSQLKRTQKEETPRPPLGPSEKNNAALVVQKIRTREIASRYKSGISSTANSSDIAPRRCPSPNACRSPSLQASLRHRAQSAERRRSSTPSSGFSLPSSPSSRPSTSSSTSSRSNTPVRDSVTEMQRSSRKFLAGRTPDGLWPSMRNLSSSFQSNSLSIPSIRKDILVNSSADHTLKSSANAVAERKTTPLRGRKSDHSENAKPVEKSHATMLDKKIWPGVMGGKAASDTSSRSNGPADKVTRSGALPVSPRGASPRRMPVSGGLQKSTNEEARKDAVGKVARDMTIGLNASSHPSEAAFSATRLIKSQSSPISRMHRPQSPSRTSSRTSFSSMGTHSPSRTRTPTPFSSSSSIANRAATVPSVLNYIADVRKGKKSSDHIDNAHQLRLHYNRHLQWRFVNARAEVSLSIQKIRAESTLRNVWSNTSELRDAVILKRINLQRLKGEMKYNLSLIKQLVYLEEWAALDGEHYRSLSGAIEALNASTLRLPVTEGAKADVHAVRNAVNSAVDVMQAMCSSISQLLPKVEGTEALISELSAVAAKERTMLDECRKLLASTATMQIHESSLRTHLIQHKDGFHN